MSIDLEGWYITTKKPGYSVQGPEKLFLPVVGANHSHFPFEWWEADEKATFLEQYELVLNSWGVIPGGFPGNNLVIILVNNGGLLAQENLVRDLFTKQKEECTISI